ncbi:YVTN repeat-like/Quino protein amine dehydrogenase [Penicillium angulare]|uniref:YVTN repeat-like/Quino protein amine dehydrogenase n=1 Tax=Penicillium angulare TaxID=116970 RepID=UPI00253FB553|nr:YVTN repeat-like/Quino protein amine dehydrogenase [Penicillium angulare]KAJ5261223.1 YVTN repeat-like/Quino protein amine dehydrogenase [Penicillium angulare]
MTETSLTVESYSTDIWKLAFGRLEPKEQQSLIPKHMTNRTSDNLPESSTNISPNLNEINQLAKEIYNEEDKKERIITRECARNICSSVAACKDIPRLFSPVYRDSDRFAGLGWQALYLGLDVGSQ